MTSVERGDADGRAVGGAFDDRVGGGIAVHRRRWRDVGHRDGEVLRIRQRAVAGLHGDGVGVAGSGFVVDLGGIGDGDDAGRGIDGEAAAGSVAGQRVGDGRAVDVGRRCGDADRGAVGGAFDDRLAVASLSTGVVGATSVTAMVKFCEFVSVPSLACAVTL